MSTRVSQVWQENIKRCEKLPEYADNCWAHLNESDTNTKCVYKWFVTRGSFWPPPPPPFIHLLFLFSLSFFPQLQQLLRRKRNNRALHKKIFIPSFIFYFCFFLLLFLNLLGFSRSPIHIHFKLNKGFSGLFGCREWWHISVVSFSLLDLCKSQGLSRDIYSELLQQIGGFRENFDTFYFNFDKCRQLPANLSFVPRLPIAWSHFALNGKGQWQMV